MDYSWFIAILSISGAILNIRKNKYGFLIWVVANASWIIVDINVGLYSQIPIWVVFSVISVYGFVKWRDEECRT